MFTLLNGVKLAFFNIDTGPVNTDFILKTCCLHLLGFPYRRIWARDDIPHPNKVYGEGRNSVGMLETRVNKDDVVGIF